MNNDENSWIPVPPGGAGRLRALLASIGEDQKKLSENPLYKEGYDDGYQAAQGNELGGKSTERLTHQVNLANPLRRVF
jgi:hypothetical protein